MNNFICVLACVCYNIRMTAEKVSNRRYFDQVIAPKFAFLKDPGSLFYYVLILIAAGFGFFAYALTSEHFTTPYGGDFSQQGFAFMYNFYDSWWAFLKTGNFPNFVHGVLIGADNVQANAFYGLFSPFSIPVLFFPRDWIPQVMSLISVARLVVGGLLFRIYLKYMGVTERTARIFAFAYAFTGWVAYYLWFNSFYEVLSFFPLVVLGVEKIIKEKKITVLFWGFFLLGISNYFFLLTAGIFGVIYAFFRFFQTFKERKGVEHLQVIGLGFLGFLFASGSSMIIVLPALIPSFTIDRAASSMYFTELKRSFLEQDWDSFFMYVFYDWNASVANSGSDPSYYYFSQYFPLASFFFPVISNRFTNILHLTYFENTAVGMFLYTPCLIMLFASIYRSIVNRKVSHLIGVALVSISLLTPFFYFLSGAFAIIYGRWAIVVPIVVLTYVAINYDHKDELPRWVILISGLFTAGIQLLLFFKAKEIAESNTNITDPNNVLWLVIYELIVVGVESALMTGFWKSKHLNKILHFCLAVEATAMGTFIAFNHGLQSYETSVNGGYNNVPTEQAIFDEIKEEDPTFYRILFSRAKEGTPNMPLVLGYNGASAFHTFYNSEIDDFSHFSLILKGDTAWSGSVFAKRSNLDEFLGVKYYVTKDSETSYNYKRTDGTKYSVTYEPNIPLGFELYKAKDGYRVYKNKYYLNFGTSHDTLYYLNSCANSVNNNFYPSAAASVIRNEETYFKGAIMDNDDIYEIESKYGEEFNYISTAPNRDATQVLVKTPVIYKNPDNNSFSPSNPDRDILPENVVTDVEAADATKFQIVYEPRNADYFPFGEEGAYYMLDYPVAHSGSSPNFNSVIWLIGEDEQGNSKIVTYDDARFNQRNGSSFGGAKMIRGFYSKEKIKRIIVCPVGGSYRTNMPIYYEPFETTINRYQNAINNGVTNVQNYVDKFTFDSNYTENRIFVSQVAYSSGWSVKATSSTGEVSYPKVYKAQGGFVSFVAPKGEIHYEMTYSTPKMKEGTIISIASLIGMLSVTFVGNYLHNKKKRLEEK